MISRRSCGRRSRVLGFLESDRKALRVPELGEAFFDLGGGADLHAGEGAAGIAVGAGEDQVALDVFAALGGLEVVVGEEKGDGIGAVGGSIFSQAVGVNPLFAGHGEEVVEGGASDLVVGIGWVPEADVIADGGVDAGEVVGTASDVGGRHVFGKAFVEPGGSAPKKTMHDEVG